jgi:hypothetical protein
MKYFKVTNINDPEDEFYVSSTLPNETPGHLAMTLHLGEGDDRYDIVEVSKEEYETNTEDWDPPTFLMGRDLDVDDDYEDDDDEFWD